VYDVVMLQIDDRDGLRTIRINHGKAGALDLELCEALTAAFRDAASSKAVVLTGTGRIFSAGVDLPRVLSGGDTYTNRFLPAMNDCFQSLFSLERPVVAAINGHAIAGGCILACACDARVMAEEGATIGAPELVVGVPFPVLALEILRLAGGDSLARRLTVGGGNVPAAEALRIGLVDRVAPGADVEAAALAEARRLSEIPSAAFSLVKRQLRAPAMERVAALKEHDAQVSRAWGSPEIRARIASFVERTLGRKA
jgi:enoyl-CoA hydratase